MLFFYFILKLECRYSTKYLPYSLNVASKTIVLYLESFPIAFLWSISKNINTTYCKVIFILHQLNPGPVYEDISAQETEQDDLHYSRVHFSKNQTDPLYSTIQPHQPGEQDQVLYSVVNLRSNTTPE